MNRADQTTVLILILCVLIAVDLIFFSGPKSARGLGAEDLEAEVVSSEAAQASASASAASASAAAAASAAVFF
ncbi:MAG: hypothetical protein Q8930_08440 [Bacillota bacterium]|nr:hypothetical protein [Bacillota bacterium]